MWTLLLLNLFANVELKKIKKIIFYANLGLSVISSISDLIIILSTVLIKLSL